VLAESYRLHYSGFMRNLTDRVVEERSAVCRNVY